MHDQGSSLIVTTKTTTTTTIIMIMIIVVIIISNIIAIIGRVRNESEISFEKTKEIKKGSL
jgi:hypothetical protein